MVIIDRSAIVSHSDERLYRLVDDVETYPDFLPWCSGAEVVRRSDDVMLATLHVGFGGIRQRFTTENVGTPHHSIRMKLVSGPFRALEGEWRFTALSESASRVALHLEYEISSRMLENALGTAFRRIADTLLDAFVRRADQHP